MVAGSGNGGAVGDPGEGHRVDPADEGRHPAEDAPLWQESYYLDFVSDDGALAGYVRCGVYPNLKGGVTWWDGMVVGPDRAVVATARHDLPVADGPGMVLTAPGYDVAIRADDPLARMAVRGTTPASVHGDPGAVYRDDQGDPTTVAWDLTWTTDGLPYQYDVTTRYEIPCLVEGEVTVGGERLTVHGQGQRDHSWGERDWWSFGWCWTAARLDDGTRLHFADIRIPGWRAALGYVQHGGALSTVTACPVDEDAGVEGMPTVGTAVVEPGPLDVRIEPFAYGPIRYTASDGRTTRFHRAAARFSTADGRSGTGWVEWNKPEGLGGDGPS